MSTLVTRQRHLALIVLLLELCLTPLSISLAQERPVSIAQVLVVPIEGEIQLGLAAYLQRVLSIQQADTAVLLEINTFGGRVDAATQIRDAILNSRGPVYALVTGRALSAGALIALAAERLLMAPGSTIGAAEPRPLDGKTVSAFAAEFEATAVSRGRDPAVAGAMVDRSREIPGLVGPEELLTLTADKAEKLGFCEAVVMDRGEALALLGLEHARVVESSPRLAEKIAGFLTAPLVSSLLLTLGLLGIWFEVITPGFGVAGALGLGSLALFFGSRVLAGLAGVESLVLVGGGLLLLLLEVLVPGFGVAGAAGLVAILAGMFAAFDSVQAAMATVVTAVAASALVAVLTLRYVRRRRLWQSLILDTAGPGEKVPSASSSKDEYLGQEGRALTVLRPAGRVEINGQRISALSEGEYIPAGRRVRVVAVEGNRVVVREVTEHSPASGDDRRG